jgi:peptidoglycan hydrolase CwlO-like protein
MFNKFKISLIFLVFIFSVFIFPDMAKAVTCSTSVEGKNDIQLQEILDQCDREIAEQKKILGDAQKQSSELEKAIAETTYNINKTQLEINARNAKIKQLGENIVTKTEYIGELSVRMIEIKKSIGKMMKDSYDIGNISMVETILSSEDLSNLFKDIDDYSSINKKLRDLISELTGVKKNSENQKTDLESRKLQEEKLKFEQDAEKRKLETYKKEKQELLKFTKGQESLYQASIAEKERQKNQIRNKMFKTVGGQEISFGDALKLIQPYESTIGVNSALVLSVLFQESAVDSLIGKNIGKCTYNQASSCIAGKTVMSETQKPSFLNIMSKIGRDPDTTPISCAICRDGNYGGAMGPAQFMPETWNGIAGQVSKILGIGYPSPFENLHAFTASAVLLKDNQNRCKTAFTKKSDIWACSASKYYGGLYLMGSRLINYMYYGYGASVTKRALQFEKDIDLLNS